MDGLLDSPMGDGGAVWVQGLADTFVMTQMIALIPLTLLLLVGAWVWRRRRQFWCADKQREVEVEFEMRGIPGFRHFTAVKRCSAFEPGAPIECRRRCIDSTYRRQWEPALPIATSTRSGRT